MQMAGKSAELQSLREAEAEQNAVVQGFAAQVRQYIYIYMYIYISVCVYVTCMYVRVYIYIYIYICYIICTCKRMPRHTGWRSERKVQRKAFPTFDHVMLAFGRFYFWFFRVMPFLYVKNAHTYIHALMNTYMLTYIHAFWCRCSNFRYKRRNSSSSWKSSGRKASRSPT